MSKLVYFLILVALLATAVFDSLNKGGPYGGFFLLACIVGAIGVIFYGSQYSWKRWVVLIIGAAALYWFDQIMGDSLFQVIQELHRTATKPFEGTNIEKQAHYFDSLGQLELVAWYATALFLWAMAVFPDLMAETWARIRRFFSDEFPKKWPEVFAFIASIAVAHIVGSRGLGPIVTGSTLIAVFLVVYWALSLRFKLPPRKLAYFVLTLVFVSFTGPTLGQMMERATLLREASEATDPDVKAAKLERVQFSPSSDRELSLETAKAALLMSGASFSIVVAYCCAGYIGIDWLLYGGKPGQKKEE